jgi:hypothetical protein
MPNIKILSSDGAVIGSLRFTICHNRKELVMCHDFRNSRPCLEQCLHNVGINEQYPLAFLVQITVNDDCRKNDYGSSLLGKFEEVSTEHGCKLAVCKVGWPEGLSTRDGNILFYKKCNWRLYDLPDEPVMAFKVLDAKDPNNDLKRQTISKMVVYWKDENFQDSLTPKPVG